MKQMKIDYTSYKDVDLKGKKVLMRVDINSNIDTEKMEIRDSPRIRVLAPALNKHFKKKGDSSKKITLFWSQIENHILIINQKKVYNVKRQLVVLFLL